MTNETTEQKAERLSREASDAELARLKVQRAAYAACVSVSSDNPLAVAEAIGEMVRQLVDTPVLMIDVAACHARGETEMLAYSRNMVEWGLKTKALLTKLGVEQKP